MEFSTFVSMFNRSESYRLRKSGLLLMTLFVWYFACTTIFTHVHISSGILYVHSHPYAKSSDNKPLHSHTAGEFQLIHEYNQTVVDDFLENTILEPQRPDQLYRLTTLLLEKPALKRLVLPFSLRAPPALVA